jgi:hypothetical protein
VCGSGYGSVYIRAGLLGLAALTAGPAYSQVLLTTESLCLDSPAALLEFAIQYDEEPLFSGLGSVQLVTDLDKPSQQILGGVFFTVNQDTGSWSLFFTPEPGITCLLGNGRDFTPE